MAMYECAVFSKRNALLVPVEKHDGKRANALLHEVHIIKYS